ncbi:hypothetical protein [Paenibacillus stellifer]|uniref:hypothetical protein n=1 Tax=Paenibacillus stellifer TaxID=169760 RepID=UPI00068BB509|nr:hypothetical protein [Paenibacillus stellifer]
MKAYHVRDKENSGEEAYHEIVFAESHSQAKYKSEAYSDGVPWTDISAARKPEFDQYSESGVVPRSAYIEDGWYFDCDQCGGGLTGRNYIDGKTVCDSCLEEIERPKATGTTE